MSDFRDRYDATYKALERHAFRGGLLGLLIAPPFGVVYGLCVVLPEALGLNLSTKAVMFGLGFAMIGFVLGAVVGTLFGVWQQVRAWRSW